MTKLVKNSVTLESPIADIVIRDIRHTSSTTSLNELARVLARTRYALVDRKSLVTVDDLVQFMGTKFDVKATEVKNEAKSGLSVVAMAAAGIVTAGLATGAFLLSKHKN